MPGKVLEPDPSLANLLSCLRPELQLVLTLARVHLSPATVERAACLLRNTIDWEFLIGWSLEQGVLPLVYWNLKRDFPDTIPASFQQRFEQLFHANTRHNLVLTGELLQLLKLFQNHGIRAIPY